MLQQEVLPITLSSEAEAKYPLLDRIEYPQDLRQLSPEELPQLCAEIRSFMLEALSVNPGHLGANLGAVEITVASCGTWDTKPMSTRYSLGVSMRSIPCVSGVDLLASLHPQRVSTTHSPLGMPLTQFQQHSGWLLPRHSSMRIDV